MNAAAPLNPSSRPDARHPQRGALPIAVLLLPLLAACAGEQIRAASWIGPAGGTTVTGRAEFVQRKTGLEVLAHVTGLAPASDYRLLVAERTDCGARAGAQHFESPRVKADGYGNARFAAVLPGLTLLDGKRLAGKAVIVRQDLNDASQPAGLQGTEVGCGWVDR